MLKSMLKTNAEISSLKGVCHQILVQERAVFYAIQAFNWLDEAHPHAGGQSD